MKNALLTFCLITAYFVSDAQNVEITYLMGSKKDYTFKVLVSEASRLTLSTGEIKDLKGETIETINIPEQEFNQLKLSFDKPRAVRELDLSYKNNEKGMNQTITAVTINGLDSLSKLDVSDNYLYNLIENLPAGCRVDYSNQQTILNVDIKPDNIVDFSDYAHPSWNISCFFDVNKRNPVPDRYIDRLDGGFIRINENFVNVPIIFFLSHPSGLELRTQTGLFFDQRYRTLFTFFADGTGTATDIEVLSKGQGFPVVIEAFGFYSTDELHPILHIPSLKNYAGEVTVKVNNPENIKSIFLPDLGISEIKFTEEIKSLTELNLNGNSFTLYTLPDLLNHCDFIHLDEQKPFSLKSVPNIPYSFDLKGEITAGGVVTWYYENGDKVDPSYYTEEDGIFTFLRSVGKVRACLSSTMYPDFRAYSNYITIDMGMIPILSLAWAANGLPLFSIETNEEITVSINSTEETVYPGDRTYIRLPAQSGNCNISVSCPEAVTSLWFEDLGIYRFDFLNDMTGLEYLSLNGNLFSPNPDRLPTNLPKNTTIEWGKQAVIDISGLLGENNTVNMIDFADWDIQWHYASNGKTVDSSLYEEKAHWFIFGTIEPLYATLTSTLYPGLEFTTTVLNFSPVYRDVIQFECVSRISNNPKAEVQLSDKTFLELAGSILPESLQGIVELDFDIVNTDNNQESPVYKLRATNPEFITRIKFPGMGINKIKLSPLLNNLELLDLSNNNLTFSTFPEVDKNCLLILDNQAPVELEVNSATGRVDFPSEFHLCELIEVKSNNGSKISEEVYHMDDNSGLTFLKAVNLVEIHFSHHPYFPDVTIKSSPLTFLNVNGIDEVFHSSPVTVVGHSVSVEKGSSVTVYSISGQLVDIINGGETVELQKGMWILKTSTGRIMKILIR